jgi:RHS repeat-associated protein
MGGGAGTKDFLYDSNGNEIRMATPLSLLYQRYDGANRLFNMKDDATGAETYLTYDGRNFLTQARQSITTCCAPVLTQSVYSSEGVLQGRSVKNILGGTVSKDTKVFYFSGRPVGLLETTTAPATLSYLSVDHLGTPILATNGSGTSLWSGGFEPFGKDWNGAQAAGEFLRFPGQWEDGAWAGSGFDYNVRRWYRVSEGRYGQVDPLQRISALEVDQYLYGLANPIRLVDPLGLFEVDSGCKTCTYIWGRRAGTLPSLAGPILRDTNAWCREKVSQIPDVNLRRCIQQSCISGRVKCDQSCPNILGYTEGAGDALHHWLRRIGLFKPIREAIICGNYVENYTGEAGNTLIHEWAHGCGYDNDDCTIRGIPCSAAGGAR